VNSEILIFVEFIVFLFGFVYIFKREKLLGVYYFFLFVYAIFAQIGYLYFPELSIFIKAYFGEGIWFRSTSLIILSFFFLLLGFALTWRSLVNFMPLTFFISKSRYRIVEPAALILLVIVIFFQISYLILNFENINWYTNQDEDFRAGNIIFSLYILIFKYSVGINIVLYGVIKGAKGSFSRRFYIALLVASMITFLVSAARLGNRTDLLAFGLGIMIYHLYRDRFDLKRILQISVAAALLGVGLYLVEINRYSDGGVDLTFWAGLMTKDWYAPAHMLFAAVNHNIIDPIEVVVSNASNSLILVGHPYLQYGITEAFNPGIASRSAGYAFYIFTEGYMVLGDYGFIYNAMLILLGFSVWKKFASTNNKEFNNVMLGLMGCMVVNLVRGQGSYFIKYFYTFILPSIFLYSALSGQSLALIIKSKIFK
jgi:hypothetical protein